MPDHENPMDPLGHLLIRAHNGDEFDPFFVPGHSAMPATDNRIVRACYYYAVVMDREFTFLYDNDGRGGMCDLIADEIVGIWRTPELLTAVGASFEGLRDGTATLTVSQAPKPDFGWEACSALLQHVRDWRDAGSNTKATNLAA